MPSFDPLRRVSRANVPRVLQIGVTLIELLVAMIIALLGIIVIFTVFQNAEGYKRTTIAGGDAQTNGALSIFAIERYVRTAGSAITTTNESQLSSSSSPPRANLLLGCPLFGFPNPTVVTGPAGAPTTPVAPVRIVDGGQLAGGTPATSDVLVIMAGNADLATNPTPAAPLLVGSTAVTNVVNTFGWRAASGTRMGDIALFVQSATTAAATISAMPCSARRIQGMSTATGTGTMNLAGAAAVSYNAPSTNIHNIGPTPYFLSIGVNAQQQLVQTNFSPLLTGEGAAVQTVLADGIINLQAQYGIDTNQDDVVDAWVEPTGVWRNPTAVNAPATPSNAAAPGPPAINQIKAIRLAILARAVQFEPPNRRLPTPACDITPIPVGGQDFLLPAAPVTAGSLALPQGVDILPAIIASGPSAAIDSNWQCFRYRRYETVIPVLNMIRSPL